MSLQIGLDGSSKGAEGGRGNDPQCLARKRDLSEKDVLIPAARLIHDRRDARANANMRD